MKHNKNNGSKVPNLRFPEFEGQWKRTTINNECEINPTTPPLPNLFVYVDLEAVVKGELVKREIIKKHIAPSRAQRVLRDGDILFQCVRPYQLNNYLYLKQDEQNWVASTGYAQLRTEHIGRFIYQYLYSPRLNKDVMLRCTGTSYPAISSSDLGKIDIYICKKEEQQKIASLLSLIDERISTQNKIIEKLESLIKGIYRFLLGASRTSMSLAQICDIKKGQQINKSKLSEFGKYYVMNGGVMPSGFYDYYNTNENTISISEGGNSCGYVQYNNVPFWSGGHCYTLENIEDIIDIKYLFHYLKANESQLMTLRIGSGLPNIQKKDLSHFRIPVAEIASQVEISGALDKLTTKVEVEKNITQAYHNQKQYLLSNLFI